MSILSGDDARHMAEAMVTLKVGGELLDLVRMIEEVIDTDTTSVAYVMAALVNFIEAAIVTHADDHDEDSVEVWRRWVLAVEQAHA